MAAVLRPRGRLLYWEYPLERYHLVLQKTQRTFNKTRWFGLLLIGFNWWVWSVWLLYHQYGRFDSSLFFQPFPVATKFFFWLGVGTFCYTWYRSLREQEIHNEVEHFQYGDEEESGSSDAKGTLSVSDWSSARHVKKSKRSNISLTYTAEAREVVGQAYFLTDEKGSRVVTALEMMAALLRSYRIANMFVRLGIQPTTFVNQLKSISSHLTDDQAEAVSKAPDGKLNARGSARSSVMAPVVSDEVYQILFQAYEEAYHAHQSYVSVTELFVATLQESAVIQELFYNLDLNKEKLINVVEWARIRERLHRHYQHLRTAGSHRSKHGMDRAMTAVATPYLNQFSEDLTRRAQLGATETCVAREKEIESIFQVVEGGQAHVLLVGDFGVGKNSLIEGLAERMVEDDVPHRLQDKRLVQLSISAVLAGTTPSGAVERLMRLMNDVNHAGNIILCIQNIHELTGVTAGGGSHSLDVAGSLADCLSRGNLMTIATTTKDDYSREIANSKLGAVFAKVDVVEMTEDQAVQVLESKVGYVEYKQQVFFSYEALYQSVKLARRYLHDVALPGSALEIMNEAASFAHKKKGENALVDREAVAHVVAEKTHIPLANITDDETTKLLHLEAALHQRVVGQDEAVSLVASALRRARAEIRSQSRPIANFLFLGPTGVGKTELAKTIAEVYFGGEERMIRLDMSEYQDKASVYRLIGRPGEKGSGLLTEAVHRNPFGLLLLDEIEKADRDILNLFLQVMDDGRLTDSTGRVIDFTNIILIATSNAGTAYVQEQMRAGLTSELIKDHLLHGELATAFRPEFLNRFDGIVLFKALDEAGIKQIAGLMLQRVAKDLEAKGVELQVTDAALTFFAKVGFDPEFGARPLRRTLQERVENQLAELILSGKLPRRSVVEVGEEGIVTVKS